MNLRVLGVGTVLRVRGDESGATYTVRGTWPHGYLLFGSNGEGFDLSLKATEVLMEVQP